MMNNETMEKAKAIRLVVFDVDGVLTDGSLFLGDNGEEYKAFHSRDGHGMKMLQYSGVEIGIITGRTSDVVRYRMENLGVKHVYQGQLDKLPAFEELVNNRGLTMEQVAYVGDDVVDLPTMRRAGLAIAVNDAHELVKQHADFTTALGGGRGAAREVCELIMAAQGTLDQQMAPYLK